MRSSPRGLVVAALTTAVVLSVPAVSVASAVSAPVRAVPAAASGDLTSYTRAEATLVLSQLRAALTPKSARTAPQSSSKPLPRTDLTVLLRAATVARPAMTSAQRSEANALLARAAATDPTGGPRPSCTGNVIKSAHFCIHYTPKQILNLDPNAATQQQAQLTSDTFEYVYQREVAQMGYRAPLPDGDGLLDVNMLDLGSQRLYGECRAYGPVSVPTAVAACAVDNDFSRSQYNADPVKSLQVTAAHEFFHAVQFAYDADDAQWFMEGTAVWMEDQVYPAVNDYLQYLPDSQIRNPRQGADSTAGPHGLAVYGSVVFWKYFSEHFRDNNIIRQFWNSAAASTGHRDGIAAVAAVLRARKTTLAGEFARYGIWTTLPPGTFADRSLWPAPVAWKSKTFTKTSRTTGSLATRLNHLAIAPLVLRPSSTLPTRSKLRVTVDAPNTSHGSAARVQLRYKSGKVVTYLVPLNASGNGTKLFPFNRAYLRSAIVTLTNGSAVYNSQAFKVRGVVSY